MHIGTISQAVQPAIYDVTDSSAMRSWFNSPMSSSLESDIYKATNIVRTFARIGNKPPERHIPTHILKDAAGFAILSAVKVAQLAFPILWLSVDSWLSFAAAAAAERYTFAMQWC